jgi:hypothetical protein
MAGGGALAGATLTVERLYNPKAAYQAMLQALSIH